MEPTFIQRRKVKEAESLGARLRAASMEPTFIQRRKGGRVNRREVSCLWLQWSRRLFNVGRSVDIRIGRLDTHCFNGADVYSTSEGGAG